MIAAAKQRDAAAPARAFAAPDGLLVVDKPAGPTSHDVVERVRRCFRTRQAGHLGTLDPTATGLLLVALGAATRCIPVWQGGAKTYEATLRLGITTRTQDLSGEVLATAEPRVDEAAVRAAARAFTGTILQVPPMVSALKHRGERLHDLARRGVEVERAPRRITVHAWEWLAFAPPDATFRVTVSAGTYVRTLVHDLGAALGCGAALAALRRTRSEPFGLERAVTGAALDTLAPEALWAHGGIALAEALAHLPALTLEPREAVQIAHGGRPERLRAGVATEVVAAGPRGVALRDPAGAIVALGQLLAGPDEARVRVCPQVVFQRPVGTPA